MAHSLTAPLRVFLVLSSLSIVVCEGASVLSMSVPCVPMGEAKKCIDKHPASDSNPPTSRVVQSQPAPAPFPASADAGGKEECGRCGCFFLTALRWGPNLALPSSFSMHPSLPCFWHKGHTCTEGRRAEKQQQQQLCPVGKVALHHRFEPIGLALTRSLFDFLSYHSSILSQTPPSWSPYLLALLSVTALCRPRARGKPALPGYPMG